jgi:hypothetical protein
MQSDSNRSTRPEFEMMLCQRPKNKPLCVILQS